jgi:hypothetical protein
LEQDLRQLGGPLLAAAWDKGRKNTGSKIGGAGAVVGAGLKSFTGDITGQREIREGLIGAAGKAVGGAAMNFAAGFTGPGGWGGKANPVAAPSNAVTAPSKKDRLAPTGKPTPALLGGGSNAAGGPMAEMIRQPSPVQAPAPVAGAPAQGGPQLQGPGGYVDVIRGLRAYREGPLGEGVSPDYRGPMAMAGYEQATPEQRTLMALNNAEEMGRNSADPLAMMEAYGALSNNLMATAEGMPAGNMTARAALLASQAKVKEANKEKHGAKIMYDKDMIPSLATWNETTGEPRMTEAQKAEKMGLYHSFAEMYLRNNPDATQEVIQAAFDLQYAGIAAAARQIKKPE